MTAPLPTATPAADAEALCTVRFSATQGHTKLKDWLAGRQPDKAIAAMMISAASKKPGKVVKRVSKPLGTVFEAPKVVTWDKDEKFVYAVAYTQGDEASVLADGLPSDYDAEALYQTDLYLRCRNEHTEINTVTVSALTKSAFAKLLELRGPKDEAEAAKTARQALTAARIFATGLDGAEITPQDRRSFLVPLGGDALIVENLPIDRVEHGETKAGQILSVRGVISEADLSDEDKSRISTLPVAMTKAGHPGADAFAALVRANARAIA